MGRAFFVVMDSVGIGGGADAEQYFSGGVPDTGANTLGHIAQHCANGQADEGRSGPLNLPFLCGLGLGDALRAASGCDLLRPSDATRPIWGHATEHSRGKDTPSGHWELAGRVVPFDWHYFTDQQNSFPDAIQEAVERICGVKMIGNCHASGTQIINDLGEEHLHTGAPICYTSADSVFQIAAHEERFGLDALYDLCQALAPMLHARRVGRVIARPFVGDAQVGFSRTLNRRDYALEPPFDLLADAAHAAGRSVLGIGKICDIYANRGFSAHKKGSDAQLMQHLKEAVATVPEGGLVMANFVEFDSLYGHRRDVAGYARHLEWFDRDMAQLYDGLASDDMMIITADHGNDPTWAGTDHTREQVPVLVISKGHMMSRRALDFADVGAQLAQHLGLEFVSDGAAFLHEES